MKIVRFSPEHLNNFKPRSLELGFYKTLDNWKSQLLMLCERSDCFTAIVNGEVVAIGGTMLKWGNVHDIWMVPTKEVNKNKFTFSKSIRELVDYLCEGKNRVQSYCNDDRLHNRWMRFIGFSKEASLKNFGPFGEDYALFRRLNG